MPRTRDVPQHLLGRPCTGQELLDAGLSWSFIRRHFRAMLRGTWWCGELPTDLRPWIAAALVALPADAVVSHLTALRLLGAHDGPLLPLHFSTRTTAHTARPGVVVHRRLGAIWTCETASGIVTTTAERAFVDSARYLGLRDLVRAGDALVHAGHVSLEKLTEFCINSHLDGVVRARRAVVRVCEGVESFLETDVRLILEFARLPVDGCNIDIHDQTGRFIARGDILFRRFKVLVEYDGWHHERDARQRQKDHLRRERLEAAGWIVIVITARDMSDPLGIVRRVHTALVRHGYQGPPPVMSLTWQRWFGSI